MKKIINTAQIEGRLYQHNLSKKTVSNQNSPNFGKDFISGEVEIAVDEEGLNVIPVHFTYVTEMTSKGNTSPTYMVLSRIIEGAPTWLTDGKDNALKVKINGAIALNDFYNANNELVSAKRVEGSFVSVVNGQLSPEEERNYFSTDMIITSVKHVDADPDRSIKEHAIIHGAIFDFRGALLPVEYSVEHPEGIDYFEGLSASTNEPAFTKVWGNIRCETVTVETKEESAFGEAAVRTYQRKNKNWIVKGSSSEAYDFGDEAVLTAEELKTAIQNRNVYLAEIKARADEYKAKKNVAAAVPVAKKGSYTF